MDHLNSVRTALDETGTVVNQIAYDAFGNVEAQTNPEALVAGLSTTVLLFTSREFDIETGLYYHRACYYDPSTGRWTTEDPLGFAAGDLNLYRYAFNLPVTFIDPSGRRRWVWPWDPRAKWSWDPDDWLVGEAINDLLGTKNIKRLPFGIPGYIDINIGLPVIIPIPFLPQGIGPVSLLPNGFGVQIGECPDGLIHPYFGGQPSGISIAYSTQKITPGWTLGFTASIPVFLPNGLPLPIMVQWGRNKDGFYFEIGIGGPGLGYWYIF
ncbi:MAG: RHS repeat-associated core domain-containing protein [Gemmatales bacterium]|nr:RHS repeat-associated core domain-containing protein [Gemmatales bacterium]